MADPASLSSAGDSRQAVAAAELPNELLSAIFANLVILATAQHEYCETYDDELRLKTLCNISRASKHFHALARPFLLEVLDFDRGGDPCSPKAILNILCRDPSLARGIRGIRLGYCDPSYNDDEDEVAPGQELAQLYLATVTKLPLPQDLRSKLQDGLIQGYREAEFAMLIALATKVQWLDLTVVYDFQRSLVGAVVTAAGRNQNDPSPNMLDSSSPSLPLQELQRIDTYSKHADVNIHMVDMGSLLNLPALRSAYLDQSICDEYMYFNSLKLTPSLRRLHLAQSHVTVAGLKSLLQGSAQLVDLHIECVDHEDVERPYDNDEDLPFTNFEELLTQYGTALRTVSLRMLLPYWPAGKPPRPLRSLSTLTSLEDLTLQMDALFLRPDHEEGDEHPEDALGDRFCLTRKLPTSLKVLRLEQCSRGHDPEEYGLSLYSARAAPRDPEPALVNLQLLEVLRNKSFSKLQRIEIEMEREVPRVTLDLTSTPFSASKKVVKRPWGYVDQIWQVLERVE